MNDRSILRRNYGKINGNEIELIEVNYKYGIKVEVLSYGGIIRCLEVPLSDGKRINVVLSLPNLESYVHDMNYIGCLIGRCANRISRGEFDLNSTKQILSKNSGKHHLHGGFLGFGKVIWDVESIIETEEDVKINLFHISNDGHEGYPGNLNVRVSYTITRNEVKIEYSALSDKKTHFNPTSHSYFNLSGDFDSPIDDHILKVDSKIIVEVDEELIPTGKFIDIEDTKFDFSKEKVIGNESYDTCYQLNGPVELCNIKSDISMLVESTTPGLQFYTGDYLVNSGILPRSGLCLETQFYPDSPNQPFFPTTILRPGEEFNHYTRFVFNTKS